MNLKLVEDWLPPVIYRSLLKCAVEMKFIAYPHKHIFAKNLDLKGIAKGKRAFLLATGPSINNEKLEMLAGEDCFSISNFFLHHEIKRINPLFHGFAPYHEPLILENYVEWLRHADTKLPPQTKIVLGHKTYDLVQKNDLFPDREVYYLYLTSTSTRNIDVLRPVLNPITGPLLMLPLMIYMGYEQIYLLGCDNTTLRDYKKTITNFYKSEQDMRKNATEEDGWLDVELHYKADLRSFEQYRYYQNILNGKSTSITNLSVDSWLEMFPRNRLEKVLNRKVDH